MGHFVDVGSEHAQAHRGILSAQPSCSAIYPVLSSLRLLQGTDGRPAYLLHLIRIEEAPSSLRSSPNFSYLLCSMLGPLIHFFHYSLVHLILELLSLIFLSTSFSIHSSSIRICSSIFFRSLHLTRASTKVRTISSVAALAEAELMWVSS
jgi:hypothetical protein